MWGGWGEGVGGGGVGLVFLAGGGMGDGDGWWGWGGVQGRVGGACGRSEIRIVFVVQWLGNVTLELSLKHDQERRCAPADLMLEEDGGVGWGWGVGGLEEKAEG